MRARSLRQRLIRYTTLVLITTGLGVLVATLTLKTYQWWLSRAMAPEPWVAMVGNFVLSERAFRFELEQNYESFYYTADHERLALKLVLLDRMLDKTLLLLKAYELGLHESPGQLAVTARELLRLDAPEVSSDLHIAAPELEVERQRRIFHNLLSMEVVPHIVPYEIVVSDHQIRQEYERNPQDYMTPARVELRCILVHNAVQANTILGQLKKRSRQFETLAKQHSLGPEAHTGGDLGFWALSELPPEVEQRIKTLKPGQISSVIKVDEGYAIYKVVQWQREELVQFEQVKNSIRMKIQTATRDRLLQRWLQAEKLKYYIILNLPRLLLVPEPEVIPSEPSQNLGTPNRGSERSAPRSRSSVPNTL